jgi:hypothetical protein
MTPFLMNDEHDELEEYHICSSAFTPSKVPEVGPAPNAVIRFQVGNQVPLQKETNI